jgi:hypothetical protein
MELKVGILIIGSLWWDDIYGRPDWIKRYLRSDAAVNVPAPVRYGRFSARRRSYTMLFSSSAGPGQAKVVPCALNINKPEDIVAEGERLWKVEDDKDRRISSVWRQGQDGGCVVLCVNPDRRSDDHDFVIDTWKQRVSKEPTVYSNFPKSPDDDSNLVSKDGMLSYWPDGVEVDFLLATANYPFQLDKPTSYPSARTIAQAWLDNPSELRYFTNNRFYGFHTFQDAAIAEGLSVQSDPLSC